MSENLTPVMSDETGLRIERALQMLLAVQREERDLLAQLVNSGNRSSENFYIPISVSVSGTDDDGNISSVGCSLGSVTVEELQAAYEAGKMLLADAACNGIRYLIPLSSYEKTDGYTRWNFASAGNQNPMQRPATISIMRLANGNLLVSCSPINLKSNFVNCDVSVNGTTYDRLDDALAALAGGAT